MKNILENNKMTLFLEGEVNSYNSDGIEKEINKELEKKNIDELVLDFTNLNYISSAGLRILLKLKQRYNLSIINSSLEVYDVLEMTGFTTIIKVSKAMKEVSVLGLKVIGEGFFSTVYRLDKDTIIKVFNRTSDEEQIERELKRAKQAFVLGIPTAISYDIVKVGDKLGVRFEMLDCSSLRDLIRDNPNDYDKWMNKYVELLKKINTTDSHDNTLPDMKEFYLEKLKLIKEYLKVNDDYYFYEKAISLVKGISDSMTFVHGDCHFKNIMVQGEELLLIDMDTLSRGNPIFELAAIRCTYVAFEEDAKGNSLQFLGVDAPICKKLYEDIVRTYFGKDDKNIYQAIALLSYIHMVWWTLINDKDNDKRLKGCQERLIHLLNIVDDCNIEV